MKFWRESSCENHSQVDGRYVTGVKARTIKDVGLFLAEQSVAVIEDIGEYK